MLSSSTPFFLLLHTLHLRLYPQQDRPFRISFDSELILWDFETNPVDPLDFESKDGVLTLWFAIQSNLQYPQADIFGEKTHQSFVFFALHSYLTRVQIIPFIVIAFVYLQVQRIFDFLFSNLFWFPFHKMSSSLYTQKITQLPIEASPKPITGSPERQRRIHLHHDDDDDDDGALHVIIYNNFIRESQLIPWIALTNHVIYLH